MNSSLQDRLYQKYPKIFAQKDLDMTQTAMCWGISCGDGWFNIIDNLCSEIQSYIDEPTENLKRYEKYLQGSIEAGKTDDIEYWTTQIESVKSISRPQVQATQIKEKFGTLRFYLNQTDEVIDRIVSFAESMSGCTCEKCGSPARQSKGGWITTECTRCKGEI